MHSRSRDELVSVVMPVHNALPHLDAAVSSILDQTHRNFEFVIYDDGSTDGSAERLREWADRDKRIRLIHGDRNLGPAQSSNFVVGHASAQIIARMDADDVSHPERISRQLELLQDRPEVGLVATLSEIIDANGAQLRGPEFWRVTRNSWHAPFQHGSIMYRRKLFERVGGYRHECEFWEDQDFVLRMAAQAEIMVIPVPLYRHRQSTASTRIASDQARVERAVNLMYQAARRLDENRSYDDLLQSAHSSPRKLDPRVFVSLGSLTLWAGRKPRLFHQLISRGELGFDFRTVQAIAWTAWAQINPWSLRACLSFLVTARNLLSGGPAGTSAVRWSPPHKILESLTQDPARTTSPNKEIATEP